MPKKTILKKDYKIINKKLSDTAEKDGISRKIVRLAMVRGDSLLMLKRAKTDHFPGLYELPGGKLDENEDIFSGGRRELFEETNLSIKEFLSKPEIFDFNAVSDKKRCRGYVFNILPENKDIILNPAEHTEYKWVTLSEIDNLDMLSNTKALAKKILKENL
ncbi:NUDIX hydrolase [Candidatus Nomurabacteria bacterium]|nr:NUDIX hydrolase [Candidatus Nomurabacteria bacterium]